jgi:hypothetical protein
MEWCGLIGDGELSVGVVRGARCRVPGTGPALGVLRLGLCGLGGGHQRLGSCRHHRSGHPVAHITALAASACSSTAGWFGAWFLRALPRRGTGDGWGRGRSDRRGIPGAVHGVVRAAWSTSRHGSSHAPRLSSGADHAHIPQSCSPVPCYRWTKRRCVWFELWPARDLRAGAYISGAVTAVWGWACILGRAVWVMAVWLELVQVSSIVGGLGALYGERAHG